MSVCHAIPVEAQSSTFHRAGGCTLNTQTIRIRLIEKNMRLKDLSTRSGVAYDRLQKILHGYRSAQEEEIASIARVLDLPVAVVTKTEGHLRVDVD